MSITNNHPQKIGPWRLGKTLGSGSTGRVLLATNVNTGQKAAVKVVSKSALMEEEGASPNPQSANGLPYGIEREIIIMKLLNHPNVLRLYDVWETSKALYLVLEFVEGGELFDLLVERGPLQEQEAIKYFRQIVLGTAYCHALGICHRDLKPENLLLDASLNVKLADFGMAALESNGKLLETSCGSPHYAAPEIVSGLKYHGAASDVWSCGVILFALLTGRLPFDDENIRNLLLKVQAGSFEMPTEISKDAQDLIFQMLAVDPLTRITTNDILQHPLLLKYPIPNEDLISVKSLPHPETASKSLGSIKNIDKQILGNLSILWNDRPQKEIVDCLLKPGTNAEKTFYALLLRYSHNQEALDDAAAAAAQHNIKNGPSRSSSFHTSPSKSAKKKAPKTIPVSRPTSFQYSASKASSGNVKYNRMSANISSSTSFSTNSSPTKRPSRVASKRNSQIRTNNLYSPYRSPHRSPRRSPFKSPNGRRSFIPEDINNPIPRNLYNEIVQAQRNNQAASTSQTQKPQQNGNMVGMNSAALMGAAISNHQAQTMQPQSQSQNHNHSYLQLIEQPFNSLDDQIPLMEGASITTSVSGKRNSVIRKSMSRMSRKSLRNSVVGLKRNSITMKVLATYAKFLGETDWEYMDKQTKRTSATFATLCDKIFNQEEYNREDEQLMDEDEKEAREYEKLMEIERKKHEAELKARRELKKLKTRQKRKSLLSSRKLSIMVKESQNSDIEEENEDVSNDNITTTIEQPKRLSLAKQNDRALSTGVVEEPNGDSLTRDEIEGFKRRSVTAPNPQRRSTPTLTRRPVSRLDPLWTAFENEKIEKERLEKAEKEKLEVRRRRQEAQRESQLQKSKKNRESMISVMVEDDMLNEARAAALGIDSDDEDRISRDSYYNGKYELPEPKVENLNLSEEYMSEIRKSRLLNSKLNLSSELERDGTTKRVSASSRRRKSSQVDNNIPVPRRNPPSKPKEDQGRNTLISGVEIPTVTRKSKYFTNSNKRLSVLTMYSTKESFRDLHSIINEHTPGSDEEGGYDDSNKVPNNLRTSYADRLDKFAHDEGDYNDEDGDGIEEILLFDNEARFSTYSQYDKRRLSRMSAASNSTTRKYSRRPISKLPDLPSSANKSLAEEPGEDFDADDTFVTIGDKPTRQQGKHETDVQEDEAFYELIKLPDQNGTRLKENGKSSSKPDRIKSMLPTANLLLIPNGETIEQELKYDKTRTKNDPKVKSPLRDTTNVANSSTTNQQQPSKQYTYTSSDVDDQGKKRKQSFFRKFSWASRKTSDENHQGTTTAGGSSRVVSEEDRPKGSSFLRWFSGSHNGASPDEVKRFKTILPKDEMGTALYSLLKSWSNFGLKDLRLDKIGYNITGAISSNNAFELKSCKFRIKINAREMNQRSEIVCARVKGSKKTTDTLFAEIEKVLRKEGVLDGM